MPVGRGLILNVFPLFVTRYSDPHSDLCGVHLRSTHCTADGRSVVHTARHGNTIPGGQGPSMPAWPAVDRSASPPLPSPPLPPAGGSVYSCLAVASNASAAALTGSIAGRHSQVVDRWWTGRRLIVSAVRPAPPWWSDRTRTAGEATVNAPDPLRLVELYQTRSGQWGLHHTRPAQVSGLAPDPLRLVGAAPDPLRLVELYHNRPAKVSGAAPDKLRSVKLHQTSSGHWSCTRPDPLGSVGLHQTRSGQWSCTRPAQVSGDCTRPALHQTRSGQWSCTTPDPRKSVELYQTRSGQWNCTTPDSPTGVISPQFFATSLVMQSVVKMHHLVAPQFIDHMHRFGRYASRILSVRVQWRVDV